MTGAIKKRLLTKDFLKNNMINNNVNSKCQTLLRNDSRAVKADDCVAIFDTLEDFLL